MTLIDPLNPDQFLMEKLRKKLPQDYESFSRSIKKEKKSAFYAKAEEFMDKIHLEVEEEIEKEEQEEKGYRRRGYLQEIEIA